MPLMDSKEATMHANKRHAPPSFISNATGFEIFSKKPRKNHPISLRYEYNNDYH